MSVLILVNFSGKKRVYMYVNEEILHFFPLYQFQLSFCDSYVLCVFSLNVVKKWQKWLTITEYKVKIKRNLFVKYVEILQIINNFSNNHWPRKYYKSLSMCGETDDGTLHLPFLSLVLKRTTFLPPPSPTHPTWVMASLAAWL